MHFSWILIPTLGYTIISFIRLNFLNLKSFKTSKDINVSTSFPTLNSYNYLYFFYLLGFTFIFFLLNSLIFYSIWSDIFNLINPTYLVLLLLVLACFITGIIFFLQKNSLVLVNFLLLFSLITLLLLNTTNLLQFYIVLEILAYTNILFFVLFKLNSHQQSNQWLVASIISFLLNFITSIIFFMFISFFIWRINYPSWEILTFFKPVFWESILVSLFIITKLGVGPWLVGNYHSYLGYNLYYLIIYTINMLIIVTPLLLSFYFYWGNSLFILLFLIYLYIYIASTLQNVKSLKSLFAYSTVILYTYLFLICIF